MVTVIAEGGIGLWLNNSQKLDIKHLVKQVINLSFSAIDVTFKLYNAGL